MPVTVGRNPSHLMVRAWGELDAGRPETLGTLMGVCEGR